jgi:hypothetical protein
MVTKTWVGVAKPDLSLGNMKWNNSASNFALTNGFTCGNVGGVAPVPARGQLRVVCGATTSMNVTESSLTNSAGQTVCNGRLHTGVQ